MVQLEQNLFCCGNNLKITDAQNDKLPFESTKADRAASSFRHWQEQSQRGGERGKLHSGLLLFAYCFTFYAELCKAVFVQVYTML